MWAQLIKWRIKPGTEEQILRLSAQWDEEVGRGTDSGWQETHIFHTAGNPNEWYELVYFESEEKARRSERDAKHQKLLEALLALMNGEPEFVDLTPVSRTQR